MDFKIHSGGGPARKWDDVRFGTVRAIVVALMFAVFAVMPPFLTGAFFVSMRADIGFGPGGLGLAIGLFFLTSSAMSMTAGSFVERLGVRLSLSLGALLSAVSLFSISMSTSYRAVIIAFVIGGIANSVTQPGVGALLAVRIPQARLGLAFGIKQAGIPAATLLGGILVPTAAAAFGWRLTIGALAASSFLAAILMWQSGERSAVRRQRGMSVRAVDNFQALLIISFGLAFGSGAATAFGTFLVGAAVHTGFSEATAGGLLAFGSLLGLSMRVFVGWLADFLPMRSRYGAIISLIVAGIPGYLLFILESPIAYTVGTTIAFLAGWSWTGLAQYVVVSQNPSTPALATSILQTGSSLGAGSGPLIFGAVVQAAGYQWAWTLAAVCAAISALLVQVGRLRLRRERLKKMVEVTHSVMHPPLAEDGFEPAGEGVARQVVVVGDVSCDVLRMGPRSTYVGQRPFVRGLLRNIGSEPVQFSLDGDDQMHDGGEWRFVLRCRTWQVSNPGPSVAYVVKAEHQILQESDARSTS